MPPRMSTRSSSAFANQGAFDALRVDDIPSDQEEESADETEQTVSSRAQSASASSPPLTRTAQKKLAKEKREEAKRAKAAAKDSKATAMGATSDQSAVNAKSSAPAAAPASSHMNGNGAAPLSSTASHTVPVVEVSPPAKRSGASNNGSAVASSSASSPPKTLTDVAKAQLSSPSSEPSKQKDDTEATKKQTEMQAIEKDKERSAYWKKVYERTLYTLLMIGGFIMLLLLGHPYMILLVILSSTLVYREVTALFNIPGRPSVTSSARRGFSSADVSEDEDERYGGKDGRRREELWSKTLSWYFFAVSNYFLYGESLIYYFKHIVFVDAYFIPFARHHRFLSFMLYVFGFMAFVSGLKRVNLKHQFGLFCWVHMSLLLVVVSSHFIVNNILEGLIWFWVPASLVICNDVFAYVCGMLFGRTPLISLSPKKTVEGFVGALIITEVFAYGWATIFQRFPYMICPAVSLGMNAFQTITCEPNGAFLWQAFQLPPWLSSLVSSALSPIFTSVLQRTPPSFDSLPYTAFQGHALVMAAFASLVAPFGGFFASGFKRAFNIKDFGDSIPGHGGLTDRFDCQFLMGLFSYVYYSSLVREHHVTVGSVLQTVVTHLTIDDQVALHRELVRYLKGQGLSIEAA